MSDQTLDERVTNYLGNGGLFNPEHMEHDKVRDLIIDLRKALDAHRRGELRIVGEYIESVKSEIKRISMGEMETWGFVSMFFNVLDKAASGGVEAERNGPPKPHQLE